MNRKIARLLWPPRRLMGVAVGVIGVALLAISIAGAFNNSPPPARQAPPSTAAAAGASGTIKTDPPPAHTQTPPQPSPQTKPNTPQTKNTNTAVNPPAEPQPETIAVSLKINNQDIYTVTVPPGSNQCDVLTAARGQGRISGLSMQWYAQYESYLVTKINSQGGNWTYQVNGRYPPEGCSQTKASEGDSIIWTN